MLESLTLPRAFQQSPWPARVGLIVAFAFWAWCAIKLVWLLIAGPDYPRAAPVVGLPDVSASVQRGNVAQWHLFGNAQGGVNLAALAHAKVAETSLNLILRGTFNETRPEGGIAIIADESGVDRSYRVGDSLPGEARLEEILAGQVVLARGGVRETLSLRVPLDSGSSTSAAAQSAPLAAPRASSNPNISGLAPISMTPMISTGMPDMETYRAANLPNVQELAKQVQVFPVFANNRMKGVRLSVGRDSDVLSRAGLKSSDVVTSVNGIPLDSPMRQSQLLTNLRDAKQVQVEVERDGKTIKLQLGL